MKNNVLIGLLGVIWLVLMADIIWQGTEGRWSIADAEKIGNLEVAKFAKQIVVVAVSDDGANLCLYERKTDGVEWKAIQEEQDKDVVQGYDNSKWQLIFETEAIIGKNGLGKTKEGDGKTPVGVFLFVEAFGILDNPGTKMNYTKVDKSHYWVDDSGSNYYNQFVSSKEVLKDWVSAEHIVEYEDSYQYVLATSFNLERIPGKGSAVFLHCSSEKMEATAGCVAVPEVYMREIMKRVEPSCILIIDYEEKILCY